jgi:myo-inositol-1(or 4)-monophosphatase
MTDLSRLLSIANEAVDIGRKAALTQDLGTVTSKGDRDMASEVDFAVEQAIRSHLAKVTPEIEFLGEEEGRSGDDSGDLLWVLDPIDGTANFVHGIPLVAISLGLVAGDSSSLALLICPSLRSATRGASEAGLIAMGGAFMEANAVGLRMPSSQSEITR